jgi:chromosome segregation protein
VSWRPSYVVGAGEAELRREQSEHGQRASTIDVELARLGAEADEARRRLEQAGAEPAEGDDREELGVKLERLERRREALGRVNPLAKEEYEAEKERLAELSTQRADLEASLEELEKLRRDLIDVMTTTKDPTALASLDADFHAAVARAFSRRRGTAVLDRARPGGRGSGARRRDRAAPGGQARHAALAAPAARSHSARSPSCSRSSRAACPSTSSTRSRRRSTTRTSAACRVLRRYADRAQFIVVTHQKRTMEAADVLYGVTMGEDGVSQIVSRRLPREDAAALAS